MHSDSDSKQFHGAQTASRALDLLQAIVHGDQPVPASVLAEKTRLSRRTAYRLLRVLTDQGLIARSHSGGGYIVGSGLIALSASVMRDIDIRESARPVMRELAERTTETVTLHLRHEDCRICIEVFESQWPIRRGAALGETIPLYLGPSSKVMLAYLAPADVERLLAGAERAGQDVARIAGDLDRVRAEGYLVGIGDRIPGVGGVSVPLFGSSGVVASLTVSGPDARWDEPRMHDLAPFLVKQSHRLSAELGSPTPSDHSLA